MVQEDEVEEGLARHIPSARIGDWDEACASSEKRYNALVAPERKSLAGYFPEEFLLVRPPCWRAPVGTTRTSRRPAGLVVARATHPSAGPIRRVPYSLFAPSHRGGQRRRRRPRRG